MKLLCKGRRACRLQGGKTQVLKTMDFQNWAACMLIATNLCRKTKGMTADSCAVDLLRHLLVYNPSQRITAAEALEHPYFKQVLMSASEISQVYTAQHLHKQNCFEEE